eukprot:6204701-Prorocentrum_lima.AAC.1
MVFTGDPRYRRVCSPLAFASRHFGHARSSVDDGRVFGVAQELLHFASGVSTDQCMHATAAE